MDSSIDLRDIQLEAQADLAEAMEELMTELTTPLLLQAVRLRWATVPPEQKEMMKAQAPEVYDSIESLVLSR